MCDPLITYPKKNYIWCPWNGLEWELNAWPNFVITGAALLATLFLAWKRGYSPLEMFSARADKAFVETLWSRFS
jgi:hypothetical protein